MLSILRSNIAWLKWMLWLVIISFVLFFGVSWWQPSKQGAANWIARVNGEDVSVQLWAEQARQLEQQYRKMFGARYNQMAKNLNIPAQVAENLIQRQLILQDARRLGLGVSRSELASFVRNNPNFQKDGKFVGKEEYARRVRRISAYRSAQDFESFVADELLVRKWRNLIEASVVVTPEQIEQEYQRRHERVGFEYVALPYADFEKGIDPSPATLAAWYEAHRDRYSEGEGRRAIYVLFDDEAVKDQVQVSDQQIEDYYNENQKLFAEPEQRRASHILIKVDADAGANALEAAREKAESLAGRARSGESFAELAGKYSDDPGSKDNGGDLGWFARGRMVPEFDDAVFGTEKGAIVGPIRTNFGFHVIQLTGIREPGVRPLEEVKSQIEGQLRFPLARAAEKKAAEAFTKQAGDLESFKATADAQGLEVRDTGVVSQSGAIPGMGPVPEMIKTMFSVEQGKASGVISLPRGEVVLAVQDIVSDYVPPLSSQRERVLADFRQEKGRSRAREALLSAVEKSGSDLKKAAGRLKVELQKVDPPMVRGAEIPGIGIDPAVESAAFGAEEGELIVPVGGKTAVVALQVTRREDPDMTKLAQEKAQIENSLRSPQAERLLQERLRVLREGAEIEENLPRLEG